MSLRAFIQSALIFGTLFSLGHAHADDLRSVSRIADCGDFKLSISFGSRLNERTGQLDAVDVKYFSDYGDDDLGNAKLITLTDRKVRGEKLLTGNIDSQKSVYVRTVKHENSDDTYEAFTVEQNKTNDTMACMNVDETGV